MPNEAIIDAEVKPYLNQAKGFIITSKEDQNRALEMIKNIKQKWKELDKRLGLTAEKDRLHKEKQAALDALNEVKKPFEEAEEILRKLITEFERAERDRTQKEAERLQASRLDTQETEKEKILKQAEDAEKSGNKELAEVLRTQANDVFVPPAFQQPAAPPAEGASMKPVWKAKVLDVKKVCQLIADGKIPTEVVAFKEIELNKFAELFHGTNFDGLEIYEDIRLSVRTK